MFWSIVPLLIRMGLVHVVLIYGTNNTTTDGLSHSQILHRETGAKMVLAARIFYAAFIWIAKLTVLEFLKRTIGGAWAKSYEYALRAIYGFLLLTFIGIIIGTLAECHPISHYWQVTPDPGPQCREGLVQLIVMGVCDIFTDVVLIAFPIPVVLRSSMPVRRKMGLIALFLVSVVLIAITAYRIPSTIHRKAAQPYRSLIASLEILAAAFVANIVIIASFIKDKGVKKAKFRQASIAPSAATADPMTRTLTRTRTQSITAHHWGSDEDLVSGMGMALPTSMRSAIGTDAPPRAAPMAPPGEADILEESDEEDDLEKNAAKRRKSSKKLESLGFSKKKDRRGSDSSMSSTSTDIKLKVVNKKFEEPEPVPLTNQMSFFDVGGLVDYPQETTPLGNSREASVRSVPVNTAQPRGRPGSRTFLSDIGGALRRRKEEEDADTQPSSTHTPRSSRLLAVGTATSRSLTPVPDEQDTDRRKFSRSPKPSRLSSLRGESVRGESVRGESVRGESVRGESVREENQSRNSSRSARDHSREARMRKERMFSKLRSGESTTGSMRGDGSVKDDGVEQDDEVWERDDGAKGMGLGDGGGLLR